MRRKNFSDLSPERTWAQSSPLHHGTQAEAKQKRARQGDLLIRYLPITQIFRLPELSGRSRSRGERPGHFILPLGSRFLFSLPPRSINPWMAFIARCSVLIRILLSFHLVLVFILVRCRLVIFYPLYLVRLPGLVLDLFPLVLVFWFKSYSRHISLPHRPRPYNPFPRPRSSASGFTFSLLALLFVLIFRCSPSVCSRGGSRRRALTRQKECNFDSTGRAIGHQRVRKFDVRTSYFPL